MKKKLLFVGMLGALTLASCVDTKESDSVANVRNSKAELLKSQAQAALIQANAQAEKTKAEAQVQAAAAAYQQAQAEKVKAEKALIEAQVKAQEIANKLAEDMNNLALQEEAKRIEAQIAAYQAQIANYEKQMQNYQEQMAEATLRHQQQLLTLQQQLLQAQKDLEKAEADMKAQDIQTYAQYANAYYYAVQEALYIEDQIAAAKLSLEKMKMWGVESSLYDLTNSVTAAVKYLNQQIEQNEKWIEDEKKSLALNEAYLELLKNDEAVVTGDENAVLLSIQEKQYEYNKRSNAWSAKYGDKLHELRDARSEASIVPAETIEKVNEAKQALRDDPYYLYANNGYVMVDNYRYGFYFFNPTVTVSWTTVEDVLASKEYETKDGGKYSWETDVYRCYSYNPVVGYPEYMDIEMSYTESDVERIEVQKSKASYTEYAENAAKSVENSTKNAAAFKAHAALLEAAMNCDSVKVDGKVYNDSLIVTWNEDYTLVSFVKAKAGDVVPSYSYNDLKGYNGSNGVVQNYYQTAQDYLDNTDPTIQYSSAYFVEYYTRCIKALDMYVAIVTTDEYKNAYNEKVEAYKAALAELYTPWAKADVEYNSYSVITRDTDEEYAAIMDLNDEINALRTAYNDIVNGNNAIESAEQRIKTNNDNIAAYEQNIKDLEEEIKEIETTGKINELDIKTAFENSVAYHEKSIANLENQLKSAQTVADAYKKILDSLVAE